MHKTNTRTLIFSTLLVISLATIFGGLGDVVNQPNRVNNIYFGYAQEEGQQEFTSNLNGQSEVPLVETNATGTSQFELNDDRDEMSYDLEVQDLEGVLFAHIHEGNNNENGPIIVTLFNESEPMNEVDGELASGDFTSDDFEGTLQGKTMTDLVNAINSGDAYVNVHTEANPSGELRGTIEQGISEIGTSSDGEDIDEVSSAHHH